MLRRLDGKKTALGVGIMLAAVAGFKFGWLPVDEAKVVFLAGLALTGIGGAHKVQKARRTRRKDGS